MNASVNWKGNLSFTGTADTGFEVPLGARPEVGGDNDGFRPMELMAISLAGCTAMDVISILEKKRQQITGYRVDVEADRAQEHPKVFTAARIAYHITGHDVSEDAVRRSIELSASRYCPAQSMLGELMPIDLQYFIYEEMDDGKAERITTGEYHPEESGE